MKLRRYDQIVAFIGRDGKSCDELFTVVDLRCYWKFKRKGLFYFDDKSKLHKAVIV